MKRVFLKNMQKTMRTLIVTGLLLASAQAAFAGLTVTTTGGSAGYGSNQTGLGGEFTLQQGGGLDVAKNYSATTSTANTFQSFCLEYNEHINGNTTYSVILNNASVNGGSGGATNNRDPISIGTAWLYKYFAAGTLAGYDYTGTGRSASAAALQNAIWYLEGEISMSDPITNIYLKQLTSPSQGKLSSLSEAMGDNNNRIGGVAVLNLYTEGHAGDLNYRKQDQLVATPTPIPAAAWLLGSGLLGLVGIKRKRENS